LVFLLLDIETCPCYELPSSKDRVLGFGLRECNIKGCDPGTDYIYTWNDVPSCNNVYECERSTLKKLLEKIDEYRRRGEKNVYVIGYNIKTFDLPILSYRLYKTNTVDNVSNAIDLMLGIYKNERRITYLDIMDIAKTLVFPKVRCLKASKVAEASSRCLGEDVRLSEDDKYLKFLKEKCMDRLCKNEAMLDAEIRKELGDKVKERLEEDLRRLTIMYRLLLASGNERRERNIQCLATELGRMVDECQKGKE